MPLTTLFMRILAVSIFNFICNGVSKKRYNELCI